MCYRAMPNMFAFGVQVLKLACLLALTCLACFFGCLSACLALPYLALPCLPCPACLLYLPLCFFVSLFWITAVFFFINPPKPSWCKPHSSVLRCTAVPPPQSPPRPRRSAPGARPLHRPRRPGHGLEDGDGDDAAAAELQGHAAAAAALHQGLS